MAHLREVWSNDEIKTRREKPKKLGEPAPTIHHHKSHMESPGPEPKALW
jgi:hypothetical protein